MKNFERAFVALAASFELGARGREPLPLPLT
jgi:hypothetical protein